MVLRLGFRVQDLGVMVRSGRDSFSSFVASVFWIRASGFGIRASVLGFEGWSIGFTDA